MAQRFWPGESALGKSVRLVREGGGTVEIVGVVGDVQLKPGFGDRGPLAAMPLAYIPLAQTSDGMVRLMHGWFSTALIVRAPGVSDIIVPVLRQALDR